MSSSRRQRCWFTVWAAYLALCTSAALGHDLFRHDVSPLARILIASASCALLVASLWARRRLFVIERRSQRGRQLTVAWALNTAAAAGGVLAALAGDGELSGTILLGAAALLAITPPKILPGPHD